MAARTYQCITFLLLFIINSLAWSQTIVIVGDMPYNDMEKQMLQGPSGVLYQLINETKPSMIMHLGDLKAGSKSCTDSLLKEHKALLAQIYPNKLIYTPGDNEWTDCDRKTLKHSYDELERLDYLIKLMYQTPPVLDQKLKNVQTQNNQIENKLWINERLAVASIHLVGTSNGRANIYLSNKADAITKVDIRDKHNFNWLKKIEQQTKDFDALIIGFQADIYQKKLITSGSCNPTKFLTCDAFSEYRQAFKELAKRINKPVLISHGDTSEYCFEQMDNNLWHLNAAGDYAYPDATKVTYNKNSTSMPFSVSGLIKPELPKLGCNN